MDRSPKTFAARAVAVDLSCTVEQRITPPIGVGDEVATPTSPCVAGVFAASTSFEGSRSCSPFAVEQPRGGRALWSSHREEGQSLLPHGALDIRTSMTDRPGVKSVDNW